MKEEELDLRGGIFWVDQSSFIRKNSILTPSFVSKFPLYDRQISSIISYYMLKRDNLPTGYERSLYTLNGRNMHELEAMLLQ